MYIYIYTGGGAKFPGTTSIISEIHARHPMWGVPLYTRFFVLSPHSPLGTASSGKYRKNNHEVDFL